MIRFDAKSRFATSRRASRSVLAKILDLDATYRQRRALAKMEAHRLADIGVTRSEALSEASSPIWNAPSHWVR